jgi:16S rRNA (cytosine1402-N4)-methyltransferase
MTGSDSAAVAGGLARHLPVLARRAVGWLDVRAGGVYVDATVGAGGYSRAILATPGARVIGIDRDPTAIAAGTALAGEAGARLLLVEDCFSNLEAVLDRANISAVDGVVFDLGVSSMQLDAPERGFSFRFEGPLDMRMGREGPSAADVVAHASERDLAAIIATLGEERHARSVARAIVKSRQEQTIATTRALADVVAGVVRAREGAIHPATRTFQALRIFVNDELIELTNGLTVAERVLRPGGRLVVVAFHSLEDRIVKNFFAAHSRAPAGSRHRPEHSPVPPTLRVLTRRPETPDESETAANPRARSAKLRASERTGAAPRGAPVAALPPPLPSLADIVRGHR